MKKIVIASVIAAAYASAATIVYADTSAAIQNATQYLQAQQDSSMNSIALNVVGAQSNIEFLRTVDTSSAIAIAKPILAIVEAGEDPRTFSDGDLVQALKDYYDGTQMGDSGAVNDDIWAILALISAGEKESVEVAGMVEFLKNEQNMDGGWSWGTEGASDTDDTAVAILALLAGDVPTSDPQIVKAVEYVRSNQNADGGFLSDPAWGTDSNSATGAWVISMIYALGQDPLTWTSGEGNNPIDHILTLQDSDGGFWWVREGTSEWNNKSATADVVIALDGSWYPTRIADAPAARNINFRLEGSLDSVCEGEALVHSVFDVIEIGSQMCGYKYDVVEYSFGPMVTRIGADDGNWLYLVNNIAAQVGAADYVVSSNDEVLWYFAGEDWGWQPLRLLLNTSGTYSVGDILTGSVEYYDENTSTWLSADAADVMINGSTYATTHLGGFEIELDTAGVFELRAEKTGYVRSSTEAVVVSETSNTIPMSVDVVQGGSQPGVVPNIVDTIGFTVGGDNLLFGSVTPGQSVAKEIQLNNTGDVPLTIKAQVFGDSIFHFLKIAGSLWDEFTTLLAVGDAQTHSIELSIPTAFSTYGSQSGELIFWASRAD